MYKDIIEFIRSLYNTKDDILLHEPKFIGNETTYLNDCIKSTMVSSVGTYVDQFEKEIAQFTGSEFAVAVVNGTAAIHTCLTLAGIKADDEIIAQPLNFVSSANAIHIVKAHQVFIDVDKDTLGMAPDKLEYFLATNAIVKSDGYSYNKKTNRRIVGCIPMHTFGHPCRIEQIIEICKKYNINSCNY